jgi:hypothetical protein
VAPAARGPGPDPESDAVSTKFDSVEAAFMTLADPRSPDWAEAFSFLSRHPRTAQMMIETFSETLQHMGVEPTDRDPVTGEPSFGLADVARAMGVSPEDLALSVDAAGKERGS